MQPWSQTGLFPEQYSNHSQNTYPINGHSLPGLHCSSSIPTPGKWSDRAKEGLTFLSNTPSGIFLENNFEYQNAHYNEFGGAISANYRGCFSISCLLFDIFSPGMAPWYLVKWAISNSRGLIPHPAGLGISLHLLCLHLVTSPSHPTSLTLYAPSYCATSSPSMKTRSSRLSSSSMAVFRASRTVS